jgi:hypothetical protein
MAQPNTQALVSAATATTAIANLLVVSPSNTVGYQAILAQGQTNADGSAFTGANPNPILFHYEGEQSLTSETDITDHYIEDNTAVQDQIALRPITISTHGFIGELNNVPPSALALLQTASQKLTAIGAYAPQLSSTATLAYNEAFFAYQTISNAANSLVSSWSSLSGGGQNVVGANGITKGLNLNQQQTYFQQFFFYQQQRTAFTVQTPWAVFQNMYIWKLRPVQDAETNVITDFDVTFKMIRVASTTTGALSNTPSTAKAGQLNSQSSSLQNNGTTTPTQDIPFSQGAANTGVVA